MMLARTYVIEVPHSRQSAISESQMIGAVRPHIVRVDHSGTPGTNTRAGSTRDRYVDPVNAVYCGRDRQKAVWKVAERLYVCMFFAYVYALARIFAYVQLFLCTQCCWNMCMTMCMYSRVLL